jgi:glycosyltransferase involved in cell wall biosynthesis
MRIAHVAAYISADGAYGGPITVALDQAAALQEAGHEVTVAAGADAASRAQAGSGASVRLELFPAWRPSTSTFAGLVVPGVLAWLTRRAADFDVVHVHLTRDLVTLPAAWIAQRRGVRVVVQAHGQIRPEASRLQHGMDAVLTRRILAASHAVLALNEAERVDLLAVGAPPDRLAVVDNGVPVASAHAMPPGPDPLVLFSSRLAVRKRPRAFVAAAARVAAERTDARFELWGPDGGELPGVLADIAGEGLGERCSYRGALPVARARQLLPTASVFVLPSIAEPFGMALLEAFSAGVPAVITDQTGLSAPAADAGAALVTDGSPEQMAAAVLRLLDEPQLWREMSAAARRLAEQDFGMDRIARRLLDLYRGPSLAA